MPGARFSAAPLLDTGRLRLRAHRADDHAGCLAIWSDPAVTRYIGGQPASSEDAWKRVLRYAGLWSLLGYGYWAIEDRASGSYIGDVGFADFKRDMLPALDGMLECGWALAPAAQGKGYATEALLAIMAWAQANLGAPRMACIIAPDNLASLRVAAKAGFRRWQDTTYHGDPTVVFIR
ncbi:MAG TPA: GNAT family N-acetyltransferase [Rhodanobacter sp.]|nr:GNAT family N-acetyltransferase [Rhodanobacter sp.]